MRLNFGLYLGAQQHARLSAAFGTDLAPGSEYAFNLERLVGPRGVNIRVELRLTEPVLPGWKQATARLVVGGLWLDRLPLSWYDAEATDWPTGVARFQDFYGDSPAPNVHVWVLAVRRAE